LRTQEISLANVVVEPFDISTLGLDATQIVTAITKRAEEIKASRVFLWLDNDSIGLASALANLKSMGVFNVEIVVLSGLDDNATIEAIKTSL